MLVPPNWLRDLALRQSLVPPPLGLLRHCTEGRGAVPYLDPDIGQRSHNLQARSRMESSDEYSDAIWLLSFTFTPILCPMYLPVLRASMEIIEFTRITSRTELGAISPDVPSLRPCKYWAPIFGFSTWKRKKRMWKEWESFKTFLCQSEIWEWIERQLQFVSIAK